MNRLMDRLWEWLAKMPSTNVRIAATILLALGTGIRVVGFGWDPPLDWLGFLIVWAGLDVTQFSAKRATSTEYVTAKQGAPVVTEPRPEVGT